MYGETLDLDSELFLGLRSEIKAALGAALILADKEGKEGEISIKIKVDVETVRKYDKGTVCKEWTEPRFSWAVTRKVKENKIDHKGSSKPGYALKFDEDGRPYIVEVDQQTSLFDKQDQDAKTVIHYHFGEKKSPEVSEDAAAAEETKEPEPGEDTSEEANTEE